MNQLLVTAFALSAGAGLGVLAYGLWAKPPVPLVEHQREVASLLRFLRLPLSMSQLVRAQLLAIPVGAFAVLLEAPALGGACLFASMLVLPVLRRLRRRRVVLLERQLDGWLLAVSGTLEATPSLGEALRASLELVERPLRDELQEMQNELDFGRPLREALTGLGRRVDSQPLQAVLCALEVGRGAGGALPEVLRNLSLALRELSRLEGVLQAKTAEGRAQAFAIALVPLPLYFGVRYVDPAYFLPLETTATGHLLLVTVVVLWASALLLARRILAVAL